jgi:hypothetical protein
VIAVTVWHAISCYITIMQFPPTATIGDGKMTFEETYPRYAFSELVRLALAAASIVVRFRKQRQIIEEHHSSVDLGPTAHAH